MLADIYARSPLGDITTKEGALIPIAKARGILAII